MDISTFSMTSQTIMQFFPENYIYRKDVSFFIRVNLHFAIAHNSNMVKLSHIHVVYTVSYHVPTSAHTDDSGEQFWSIFKEWIKYTMIYLDGGEHMDFPPLS